MLFPTWSLHGDAVDPSLDRRLRWLPGRSTALDTDVLVIALGPDTWQDPVTRHVLVEAVNRGSGLLGILLNTYRLPPDLTWPLLRQVRETFGSTLRYSPHNLPPGLHANASRIVPQDACNPSDVAVWLREAQAGRRLGRGVPEHIDGWRHHWTPA